MAKLWFPEAEERGAMCHRSEIHESASSARDNTGLEQIIINFFDFISENIRNNIYITAGRVVVIIIL